MNERRPMTTVVTSPNRSYHMCRKRAVTFGDGRLDPGYSGNAPRPSKVMYTFAVTFRICLPPPFDAWRLLRAADAAIVCLKRHISIAAYIGHGRRLSTPGRTRPERPARLAP